MKRLIVGKNEGIAELVERILSEPDEDIVLIVPRQADLGESISNFHLLKREAEAGGKRVSVESVDEQILALAKSSKIEALHPLLDAERREPSLSDIVATSEAFSQKAAAMTKRSKVDPVVSGKPRRGSRGGEEYAGSGWVGKKAPLREEAGTARKEAVEDIGEPTEPSSSKCSFRKKIIFWVVLVAVILVAAVLMVNRFFSRATITINFQKTPWTYENNFLADTAVAKANFDKNVLPGELFTLQKNSTQFFPASGKKQVSEKAAGKITVYNGYSSKSQVLVATTRFLAPDGKIFRLQEQLLVPGAEIKDGKIIPASIGADVIADKAGPDYNVGPVPKLTIMGFKDTPRYDGFYGELKDGTKGGFVGEKAVPTADDIKKAKDKTTDILKAVLESNFLNSYPSDYKILDEAKNLSVIKLNVNENTDQKGNFSVFGEATLKALGFRESDVKSFLTSLASRDNPNTVFRELNLQYGDVKFDLKNGKLSFKLTSRGVLAPAFSADDFRKKILGKSVGEARSLVSGLPGLTSAKVSLWPVWLGNIPQDQQKVTISVN